MQQVKTAAENGIMAEQRTWLYQATGLRLGAGSCLFRKIPIRWYLKEGRDLGGYKRKRADKQAEMHDGSDAKSGPQFRTRWAAKLRLALAVVGRGERLARWRTAKG
jgi:hypothetical protein